MHYCETQSHDATLAYNDDTLAFECIMVRPSHIIRPLCIKMTLWPLSELRWDPVTWCNFCVQWWHSGLWVHHSETQSHDVTLVYKDDTLAFECITVRPSHMMRPLCKRMTLAFECIMVRPNRSSHLGIHKQTQTNACWSIPRSKTSFLNFKIGRKWELWSHCCGPLLPAPINPAPDPN